jgi:hypothetical protein
MDVTDHPDNNVSARNQTPSPPAALRSLMTSTIVDHDEPMLEANYEFSDPELDMNEEPARTRTRSQSRAHDVPLPPPEPLKKQIRVKRGKKIDPDYDPRPRRRIREAELIESGDE